jgi:hypothetical protein
MPRRFSGFTCADAPRSRPQLVHGPRHKAASGGTALHKHEDPGLSVSAGDGVFGHLMLGAPGRIRTCAHGSGVIASITPHRSLTCGGVCQRAPTTQTVSEVCRVLPFGSPRRSAIRLRNTPLETCPALLSRQRDASTSAKAHAPVNDPELLTSWRREPPTAIPAIPGCVLRARSRHGGPDGSPPDPSGPSCRRTRSWPGPWAPCCRGTRS